MTDEITFLLKEAAAFLHMSPEVLRRKATTGEIPGAKPGKCWVFLKSDLVEYLHSIQTGYGQASLSVSAGIGV
jgi:excisionase family DNA binding protein